MLRRLVFVLGILGAAALGATSGASQPLERSARSAVISVPTGCAAVPGRVTAVSSSEVSAGAGIWGTAAGRLVRLDDPLRTAAHDPRAPANTVVRHVVSVEGVGTAFVEDGAGTDTVVLATDAGIVRIPQHGEAVNPALSTSGDLAWSVGSKVLVRDGASGGIIRHPVPREAALAFSPVFEGRHLVVALSAPPTRAVPEDERLDDLWRISPDGRWRRLTSFSADRDRWTAVRTPVASPGGGVDFVLIRGRGSATLEPRFSLLHLEAGRVRRLASLDREMYLAGVDGRVRLWNVPNIGAARVDLVREAPDGATRTIGCGATLMDPIDAVDPDRATGVGNAAPGRDTSPPEVDGAAPSEVGILVGDFATVDAAHAAVTTIRAPGGIGASASVVDAAAAPHALRPGAFGVFMPLASDADPRTALAAFRATFPAYASTSWIAAA
jgi:hypothetical protein